MKAFWGNTFVIIIFESGEYVFCQNCKSSNTTMIKEARLSFVKCNSCGSKRSVASVKTPGTQVTSFYYRQNQNEQHLMIYIIIFRFCLLIIFLFSNIKLCISIKEFNSMIFLFLRLKNDSIKKALIRIGFIYWKLCLKSPSKIF